MNIRYKILQKSKLIFASAMFMILNLNIFSQNNLTDTNKIGLEQFHVICGKFKTFDSATNQLSIISKDTIVKFRISEYIIGLNDYDTLLKNATKWEKDKESINLIITYFAKISFNKNTQIVNHELFCKSLSLLDTCCSEDQLYIFKYDKKLKTVKGDLVGVEVGDYMHITVKSKEGNLLSFWVYNDIDEETNDILYLKVNETINEKVEIKYCDTVGYIAELGKPMHMNTCVAIIFE